MIVLPRIKGQTPEILTIWGNQYPHYRQIISILHCTRNNYHKLINNSNLTSISIDWLSLQLLHHLEVHT